MSALQVSLFDRPCLRQGDRDLTTAFPPRLQALLAYLLLYGSQSHPREVLATVFWGESSTPQSKRNLRQALWQIQAISDSHGLSPGERLFLVGADQVRLNPEANLWIDVAAFERAYALSHGTPGTALDAAQAEALRDAAGLYRGDLLHGWLQDWCLYERERFQNIYLTILDKLMDYSKAHGDYEAGLAYGETSLRYDCARERTHRRLMCLYSLSGNRTAALRQYARCRDALLQELAVKPSPRTAALYQKIKEETPARMPTAGGDRDIDLPKSAVEELLERVKGVQQTLSDIQVELQCLLEREQRVTADPT